MKDILQMLADYLRNPSSLAAPEIPRQVLRFLSPGLLTADRLDSNRYRRGSDATYLCRNKAGASMTLLLWGNEDGWGMIDVSSLSGHSGNPLG